MSRRLCHQLSRQLHKWKAKNFLITRNTTRDVSFQGDSIIWIFMFLYMSFADVKSFDVKKLCTRKDPDTGKDWRQEEKETTEDEMIEWHHWLKGHEFEQALGVGSLACCSPWGCRVGHDSNWTDWCGFCLAVHPFIYSHIQQLIHQENTSIVYS